MALTGAVAIAGLAGAAGLFGDGGLWTCVVANLGVGWTVLRHRWPTTLPIGLRSSESPQGPDEKAVLVEFREEGALLGWDVGILWFERGGIGFVGKTVSFVIPRAMMQTPPVLPAWRSTLRAPQMSTRIFQTTLGIVPLSKELGAYMTLARIDALPDAVSSETILPPTSLHPDLIARGLLVRRRLPVLYGLFGIVVVSTTLVQSRMFPVPFLTGAATLSGILVILAILTFGTVPPRRVRESLLRD